MNEGSGAPEVSLDWLKYIQMHGRWSDLAACMFERAGRKQGRGPHVLSCTLLVGPRGRRQMQNQDGSLHLSVAFSMNLNANVTLECRKH